ncbi:ABC transporter ATP-binding protein, partial [Bacteroidales bacterium MSK.15.36]|nr:ABC transporter ATP-binding protein [Bacteroidales bacterium MSK.15.36]
GAMVELADSHDLYEEPLHPYTQALLSAVPIPDPNIEKSRQRIILEGDVPSPINPPPGCKFQGRCKYAKPICREVTPEFKEKGKNHFVACHVVK